MALICSKCEMRVDRADAAFCPQCGGRLEPEKVPVTAQASAAVAGNGKMWAVVTALLVFIAVLLTYILVRPESQQITASSSVAVNSAERQSEAAPAEPASAPVETMVGKPYANCQVGDTFTYGSYPQGMNGEVEPIEWRVLARESDRILVIAQYALDTKAYNKEDKDTNWSQCTLRSWLNGEFMEKAFKAEEQGNLLEVTLLNPSNKRVPGGPDTSDKVFLLSRNEAERYFSGDAERCCKPTAYALKQDVSILDKEMAEVSSEGRDFPYVGNCWWWLRSPGAQANYAEGVSVKGLIGEDMYHRFYYVTDYFIAVRPAVFLAL